MTVSGLVTISAASVQPSIDRIIHQKVSFAGMVLCLPSSYSEPILKVVCVCKDLEIGPPSPILALWNEVKTCVYIT